MLESTKSQTSPENHIDLTSMLDVIFIVLIFFIASASFVKEQALPLNKPNTSTSQATQEAVVLKLYLNDRVGVQGRTVAIDSVGSMLL